MRTKLSAVISSPSRLALAAVILSALATSAPAGEQVCDPINGNGLPCDTGQHGQCAPGTTLCLGDSELCIRDRNPEPERCDGLDNNCNGEIDEGEPEALQPCDTGESGVCADGLTRCRDAEIVCQRRVDPGPETCDGRDNDCDGIVDEGNPGGDLACLTGGQGACAEGRTRCIAGEEICVPSAAPAQELCNGQDDDCDGTIDEGNPGGGETCPVPGQIGRCGEGMTACQEGVLRCLQQVHPGDSPEICDGEDNDCNGLVDDNPVSPAPGAIPDVGDPCDTLCGEGVVVCRLGALRCDGPDTGSPEICDGVDNDCDGIVDEEVPGEEVECQTGRPGLCATGRTRCVVGAMDCVGDVDPVEAGQTPEVCDNEDNNCNGQIDEGDPGGGVPCQTGEAGVCAAGTTACGAGVVVCRRNVQPRAETCDNLDNNCNGQIDEGNPGGGAQCDTGLLGQCMRGVRQCRDGELRCDALLVAQPEICNGLDDDCDGQIDEADPGGGGPCDTGELGVCAGGLLACDRGALRCQQILQATPEACDGRDNDCDGAIDETDPQLGAACPTGLPAHCGEGIFECRAGRLLCVQESSPDPEVCDGVDNDCDGQTDEGNPGGGEVCGIEGALGRCATGVTTCVDAEGRCVADHEPVPELCDGLDNDCDGQIDEEDPGGGEACETGRPGICALGTTTCADTRPICVGHEEPALEICDGLDNDCDGAIDEGDFGRDVVCATGQPGICAAGHIECIGGGLRCVTAVEPAPRERCDGVDETCDGQIDEGLLNACGVCGALPEERCNGVDDDCDGEIDEGDLCEGELVCAVGRCAPPCSGNECVEDGLVCVDGGCVQPCEALQCPRGQRCEVDRCVDPCAGVRCGAGEACRLGECFPDDCYEIGCLGDNEICYEGTCLVDPCAGTNCAAHEACQPRGTPPRAECVGSCAPVACALDHVCHDGECVEDPCFDVECAAGLRCDADAEGRGVCRDDPCADIECGVGRTCLRGTCVDDACQYTRCPRGQRCALTGRGAACVPAWTDTDGGVRPPIDGGPEIDGGAEDVGTPDMAIDAAAAFDQGTVIDAARFPDTQVPDADTTGGGAAGDDGGCDCAVGAPSGGDGRPGGWALGLLLALGWARPRRRRGARHNSSQVRTVR